jgi:protein tyrosine phosphatase domain-containing protein 1
MFCGGRRCKYESSSGWKKEDLAIDGIYSHWITDDLLAMARPNTTSMVKNDTVGTFQKLGIRSIINLQTPGN